MNEQLSKDDIMTICYSHQKLLFHIAFGITRDYHLAQDVVQETYIKAYRKLDTVVDDTKLRSWLSSIVTRTAIDFVRKEKRRKEVLETEITYQEVASHKNVEEEVTHLLLQKELTKAFGVLNLNQQSVLHLKVVEGMKEKEIAEALHLNQNNVKTVLYRARKKLSMHLAEINYA
jgi:RNA polymerase sigma-70 factor (ECF subfamily)